MKEWCYNMKMNEIFNIKEKEELLNYIDSIEATNCVAKYYEYLQEGSYNHKYCSLEDKFMHKLYIDNFSFIKSLLTEYYKKVDKEVILQKLVNYEVDDCSYTYESMQDNDDIENIEEMLLSKYSEEEICIKIKEHMKETLEKVIKENQQDRTKQRIDEIKRKIEMFESAVKINQGYIDDNKQELERLEKLLID